MNRGADLNTGFLSCLGCTPLLYSLHKGQPGIAEYLVLQGASISGRTCESYDTRGYSVFHYASSRNFHELLSILLWKHPTALQDIPDLVHPLHLAILNKATECVRLMLRHAESCMFVKQRIGEHSKLAVLPHLRKTSVKSLTNLQIKGDSRYLLARPWSHACDDGVSFHCEPWKAISGALQRATPLRIAASTGDCEIAKVLLEGGSLIDVEVSLREAPLHWASVGGSGAMIKLLLRYGANPNTQNRDLLTLAMLSSELGNLEAIQALENGGADLKMRNIGAESVLHIALRYNRFHVLFYLLNKGTRFDLGIENSAGTSVLALILHLGSSRLPQLLHVLPSIGHYFPQESNALTAAVRGLYITTKSMKMLLKRVPQEILPNLLTHRARMGGTPLYADCTLTVPRVQTSVISLLLNAGAQLELEGGEYGTPLMGACAAGRLAAVKLLLAKGAKSVYNKDGQTFSACNASRYFPEVTRWLLVGRYEEGSGSRLLTSP